MELVNVPRLRRLARARYLALGTLGERAVNEAGQEAADPLRESVVVVRSLAVNPSRIRATVVVWAAVEYQALFADGIGLPSSSFQNPQGAWRLRLVSVRGYNPLSQQAVADPGDTSVVVNIDGPNDLLIAGGGTLNLAWTLRRAGSGRWLITGGGAP